ncbi:helix-turn-helix transcriptional regulator [Mesorhizobium sp. ES1-1]|uniref:helix-turn-helix transcriptional regulator n=1 Tax=Mesorhizobium sp. ES1-1 TaxID=2876629 RepID=UPI001CCEEFA3|nr:response regulator transcription factor [Mesorhizobium sp. ES1-1]MBZ9676151.1 response regulator transcription factor [Mesorhizobium sp. ES1-1]
MKSDILERRKTNSEERRLVVLVALRDAARAGRLSASLAMANDLLPVMAGGGAIADVVVIDDAVASSAAWIDRPGNGATPKVLLSVRDRQPEGQVYAVLPLGADPDLIAAAIRLVAAGYRVSSDGRSAPKHDIDFGGDAGGAGDDGGLFGEEPQEEGPATRPTLSPREAEVLALLAEGAPNKVIARRLNISVHTAKFHVAAILIKLGAANRTDAIAIAMRQGLVLV